MPLASTQPVTITRADFERMLLFARTVHRLKENPAYLAALDAGLPAAARLRPGWPSILMGFDFHLTPEGPRLIEINNNAGGLFLRRGHWIPQPGAPLFADQLQQRLLAMFPEAWRRIAIMDERITEQYMYPEMCAYAELLRGQGRTVWLCTPDALQLQQQHLLIDGERIDGIYNRHTDFYLESEELAHIRTAYLAGNVSLNPYPRSYALIGDKSRIVDWWRPGLLEDCVDQATLELIRSVAPETHMLSEVDADAVWQERSRWVFKPAARHGGKGVYMGRSISRKRFNEQDPVETVLQEFVPASEVMLEGNLFKLDVRLFMHGERLIALAGRAWRGQVTNFREPGSGWVPIAVGD